jgi:exopolysaccharide biosynthesis polyprenyl glycosylphosphotransferase
MKPRSKRNRTSRAKELAFAPLFAEHLANRGYQFFGEADFNAMIRRERERTERSKKPFLLALLDIKEFDKHKGRTKVMERIAYSLCAHSRSIDLKGWYKRSAVFGVLFTEVGTTAEDAKERLSDRVWRALSEALRPDELQKVHISLHAYPEEPQNSEGGKNLFDLCLYPDVTDGNRVRRASLVIKRILDILGSVLAIVLLSPVFLVIAVAIRATSPGPVLFRQPRIGLAGREFVFLKFRSMQVNNDPNKHVEYIRRFISGRAGANEGGSVGNNDPVYKITNDPRVTPFGRFLRKTSLDELPQFFNILKGEMSLVGPRPPIPYECENYEVWHRRRMLAAKPGLTGLWQVKGRSSAQFDEMVRLDLRYITSWSLWLDLRILLKTPGAVIVGKGAY